MWTVVNGDAVPMRRGDFLPQAGWNRHAHHNATDRPTAWIDGLDISGRTRAAIARIEFQHQYSGPGSVAGALAEYQRFLHARGSPARQCFAGLPLTIEASRRCG